LKAQVSLWRGEGVEGGGGVVEKIMGGQEFAGNNRINPGRVLNSAKVPSVRMCVRVVAPEMALTPQPNAAVDSKPEVLRPCNPVDDRDEELAAVRACNPSNPL
jgi:hypothetical protein